MPPYVLCGLGGHDCIVHPEALFSRLADSEHRGRGGRGKRLAVHQPEKKRFDGS